MLSINEIEKAYPERLRPFKKNILREYLQYKILDIIFSHPLGTRLTFIGGTALRIVHGLDRFSEDLDFDHDGITFNEFKKVSEEVKYGLEKEGLDIDISFSGKRAFRCNIKIPKLLYDQSLSPIQNEKILIQLDTENQLFDFTPEKVFINKFDVFRPILTVPIDLLLSQKIVTAFSRKRHKGRDFYDILFLLAKTRPNYDFLYQKKKIENSDQLLDYFQANCSEINFNPLVKDLKPFLINPEDADRILNFLDYIVSTFPVPLLNTKEFFDSQGFIYDSSEKVYYNRKKRTIISQDFSCSHQKEADEAAIDVNTEHPKIYANNITNNEKKRLIEKYLS
ncbi:nucleotidyl transferase AbiEii/AbiGii toxin family protein [Thermoproteota archaeon]